jgi:parallel beta-helix repeat protein
VTLTSYPGERATLRGQLRFNYTADGSVAEDLTLGGRNSDGLLGPLIYADGVVLRGNDITNHHEGICVAVSAYKDEPPTRNVRIEDNLIHDCGELPATNHHHGIYVSHARGTVIRGNVIYGNADRGVQLYPDADDSIVTGNVIDGNGQGVIFGGGPSSSSDDNLVANNVITNSKIRWNIQSHWQGPVGSGNVARDNCVWTQRDDYEGTPEGSGIQDMSGARAEGNVVANPGYANPSSGNYGINAKSPCADVIDGELPKPPGNPQPPVKPGGSPCQPGDAGAGRRFLVGGQGRDRLIGGTGSDRLAGRWGPDKIVGGKGGPDCLLGGLGNDRIRSVNGRRDIVKCGRGRDRATVERKDKVRGCERGAVRRRG